MKHFEEPASREDYKEGIEKALQLLDILLKDTPLHTPEERLTFLKNHSYQEFMDILIRLNGIFRGLPAASEERGINHGRGIVIGRNEKIHPDYPSWIPPHAADREKILRNVLKDVQNQSELSNAAERLAHTIILAHPLADGNGRVARVIFFILEHR